MEQGSTHAPRPESSAASDPMLGTVLAGRFQIVGMLGAGSMGTVYRAVQLPIGRPVAIKILRADRGIDEASRARFLREARANSALTSPNTVTVFDFGQGEGGEFYLAMELLEGESLGERLRRTGRLSPAAALDTVRQALHSLAEAHAKGIIHRDLKPDNLYYATAHTNGKYEEVVKVLDFGIAKMVGAESDRMLGAAETQAGTVFGTPRYMSPEQAQGKPLDARSDLYSLGVILYHMLTGRPPYDDEDAIVVMARHIKGDLPTMAEAAPAASISSDLERVVLRVMSRDPDRRPQSAGAMLAHVTALLDALPSGPDAAGPSARAAEGSMVAASWVAPTGVWRARAAAAFLPNRSGRAITLAVSLVACVAAVFVARAVVAPARSGPLSPENTPAQSSGASPAPMAPTASSGAAAATTAASTSPILSTSASAATPAANAAPDVPRTGPSAAPTATEAQPSFDVTSLPAEPAPGQAVESSGPSTGQAQRSKHAVPSASSAPRREPNGAVGAAAGSPANAQPKPSQGVKPSPKPAVGYGYLE